MRDKEYLILGKEESYKASSKVWAFQKVDDIVHGIALKLTNMAGGFPFEYNDYRWADGERLYLCGGFSNNTQKHYFIQAELCKSTSGYAPKRFIKAKYKKEIRKDFHTFRYSGCPIAFGKSVEETRNSETFFYKFRPISFCLKT